MKCNNRAIEAIECNIPLWLIENHFLSLFCIENVKKKIRYILLTPEYVRIYDRLLWLQSFDVYRRRTTSMRDEWCTMLYIRQVESHRSGEMHYLFNPIHFKYNISSTWTNSFNVENVLIMRKITVILQCMHNANTYLKLATCRIAVLHN